MTTDSGVRRYYDANTWKFLLSGSERALHRELWGPGVSDRAGAVHHVHALVLGELKPDDRRVLDLGCGVGTAALYLARRRPVEVVGVSISPEQVRLAQRYADRTSGLLGTARFVVADFTALPGDMTGFDLAFAVHAAIWVLGLPLVDNALLEPLAEACARQGRWEFLLCIAPLPIRGATGSPVNPIALL